MRPNQPFHGENTKGEDQSVIDRHAGLRENDDGGDHSKLHIGCLTRNVTEAHVREIFQTYGPLRSVDLAIDKAVNIPLGFAYVEYEAQEDAKKAKKYMDGGQIDGNVVTVQFVGKENAGRERHQREEEHPRAGQGGSGHRGQRGRSPLRNGQRGQRGRSPPRRPYGLYRDRPGPGPGPGPGPRYGYGGGRGQRPYSPNRRQLPRGSDNSWRRSRSPYQSGPRRRELSPWSRRQRARDRSMSRSRSFSRSRSRSFSRSRSRSRSFSRSRSRGGGRRTSPSRSYSSYTSASRSYSQRDRSFSRSPVSSRSERS